MVATLLPMIGGALCVLGALPWRDYDPATALITVSALLAGYVLWRYRVFDVALLARDAVIERLADGVLVLDTTGRVVDFNRAASRLFPELTQAALGHPVEAVLPGRDVGLAVVLHDVTHRTRPCTRPRRPVATRSAPRSSDRRAPDAVRHPLPRRACRSLSRDPVCRMARP